MFNWFEKVQYKLDNLHSTVKGNEDYLYKMINEQQNRIYQLEKYLKIKPKCFPDTWVYRKMK